MGDRYTYISLIGLFIIIAWGVTDMTAGWQYRKIVLATSAAIIITGLMAASWRQLNYWENSVALYTHAMEATANNAVPHNNLGNALRWKGKLEEAIPHYAAAVRIDPNYAGAHINLANALERQGKPEEAIEHYNAALRIKPNSARARKGLKNALKQKGEIGDYSSSSAEGVSPVNYGELGKNWRCVSEKYKTKTGKNLRLT